MLRVDGVISADLTTGADEVRNGRKMLNSACDQLRDKVVALKPVLDRKVQALPAEAKPPTGQTQATMITSPPLGMFMCNESPGAHVLCFTSFNMERRVGCVPGSIITEINGNEDKASSAWLSQVQRPEFPLNVKFRPRTPREEEDFKASLLTRGRLFKKGTSKRRNWCQREIVLDAERGTLSYLNGGSCKGQVQLLPLSEVEAPVNGSKYEHHFRITMAAQNGAPRDTPFELRAANKAEMNAWVRSIRAAIGLKQTKQLRGTLAGPSSARFGM